LEEKSAHLHDFISFVYVRGVKEASLKSFADTIVFFSLLSAALLAVCGDP